MELREEKKLQRISTKKKETLIFIDCEEKRGVKGGAEKRKVHRGEGFDEDEDERGAGRG